MTFDINKEITTVYPRLVIYARSLTRDSDNANDLVQDTVVKLIQKQAQFQPDTDFPAWAFVVLRNTFLDGKRRPKNKQHDSLDNPDLQLHLKVDPIKDRIEFLEMFGKLCKIDYSNRQLMLMAGIEGMTYEEIAERTGFEVGTIKSRISRTRSLLGGLESQWQT